MIEIPGHIDHHDAMVSFQQQKELEYLGAGGEQTTEYEISDRHAVAQ